MGVAHSVLRSVVPQSLRRFGQPLAQALAHRRVTSALRAGEPELTAGPLLVSGLLGEAKGVSEAARLTLAGLRHSGLSPVAHDLRPVLDARWRQTSRLPVSRPGGVWIVHVNAPESIVALAATDPTDWRGRYRIGYWAYELPLLPRQWVDASAAFHEVWTPSRFVADAAVAAGIKKPVRIMPHPVSLGAVRGRRSRATYGLEEGDFIVLAMGDLLSSAARKNLLGAIEIYRTAFPETGLARLIVKTHSDRSHSEFEQRARNASEGRPDITFLTETLSQQDTASLIASSDVLLSPHRAEGFGLSLAESFLANVPVLATGWSGNLDFMSDVSELLVRYTMTPVDDPYHVYRAPGLEWAEPDVNDAAVKLRALAASPELRGRLAARGRIAVEALAGSWSNSALSRSEWRRLVDDSRPNADPRPS